MGLTGGQKCIGYNQRIEIYGLHVLPEDRNVLVITRVQRYMGYFQRVEMYGLLLEDRDVTVITRGKR